MSVSTTHPAYDSYRDKWQRCRDVYEGEDKVKEEGTTYLPYVSSKMDTEDYAAYKSRALFYNAMARTVQGLCGLVFRKEPEVTLPDSIKEHLGDITKTGVPFSVFAARILQEILITGRHGVLLDIERDGGRPYFSHYPAETIINWRTENIGGDRVLTMLVLYETIGQRDEGDRFLTKDIQQYRVLELGSAGHYQVSIWRQEKAGEQYKIVDEVFPYYANREGLRFIPFCFFGPGTITPAVEKPPLLDLANANLSHYRSSADLEHGRHFTALPTAVFSGFNTDEEPILIGSSQAIISPDANARAQYLEFTGQGLSALEKALSEKEALMAVLGARMLLEPQKRQAEAAETWKIRQAGESATLKAIANTIGQGLTMLFKQWAHWEGIRNSEPINISLNTDFISEILSAQDLNALVGLWQAGGISFATLYHNLTSGEIARVGVSAEQERAEIVAEIPEEAM